MFNRIFVVWVALLAIGLTACSDMINIQPNADGTATLTINLGETEINTAITTALINSNEPVVRDTNVDLQDGQMVISGEYDRQNGTSTVAGSLTVEVALVNGEVQASITEVNAEGWDTSDERIQNFNQQLSEVLQGLALNNNENATLESVNITDDALSIAIRLQQGAGGN
ncbi:MAG: LmeA family phospholipid-binding protein [Anaerolineae bacterium]